MARLFFARPVRAVIAAWLQALCKEKDSDFLLSGDLPGTMTLPQGVAAQNIGTVKLRGKNRPLEIFAMSRRMDDTLAE